MAGIRVYQLTELFGWYAYPAALDDPRECLVCGAAVANSDQHQKWHNSAPMNSYNPTPPPKPKTRGEIATKWDRKVEESRKTND